MKLQTTIRNSRSAELLYYSPVWCCSLYIHSEHNKLECDWNYYMVLYLVLITHILDYENMVRTKLMCCIFISAKIANLWKCHRILCAFNYFCVTVSYNTSHSVYRLHQWRGSSLPTSSPKFWDRLCRLIFIKVLWVD